jgi:hypothetical protein
MSTTYKFNGKIHFDQIEHMCEQINSKGSLKLNHRISISILNQNLNPYVLKQNKLVLELTHSVIRKNGNEETDTSVLIFGVEEDEYISSIGRYGRQNPYLVTQFIHLIEYYTNVKIWDEYDLLDIQNWIGLYDHFEDQFDEDSLDMVS